MNLALGKTKNCDMIIPHRNDQKNKPSWYRLISTFTFLENKQSF